MHKLMEWKKILFIPAKNATFSVVILKMYAF